MPSHYNLKWWQHQLANLPPDIPECESCGCIGNEACGHKPLGKDCSLDPVDLICECCRIDPNHMLPDEDAEQMTLGV